MAISAAQVKELRDKTGAGMMDCKSALTEANGDFQKAIEILRKKGASVTAKRAERTANEGIISTRILDGKKSGIILEVNCETDFVAKSDAFVNFSNFILDSIIAIKPVNVDELLTSKYEGKKIQDALTDAIGKIGEKIEISRFAFETPEDGIVVDYVHHGSKLGVLVVAEKVSQEYTAEFSNIVKDIAMQVAAMKPFYLYREEIPTDVIEKEIDIYEELARKEGKPEKILDKIAQGKLIKFYQENCLFEQTFIKDNAKTVGDLVKDFNNKYSSKSRLLLFHRFHLSDENK